MEFNSAFKGLRYSRSSNQLSAVPWMHMGSGGWDPRVVWNALLCQRKSVHFFYVVIQCQVLHGYLSNFMLINARIITGWGCVLFRKIFCKMPLIIPPNIRLCIVGVSDSFLNWVTKHQSNTLRSLSHNLIKSETCQRCTRNILLLLLQALNFL